MHDLAAFAGKNCSPEMVRRYYDPSLCRDCPPEATTARLCNCTAKPHALERYASNLAALRSLIDAAAAERAARGGTAAPRVFWVSISNRPPVATSDGIYQWQTHDVVDSLIDLAAGVLGGSRHVSHVDFRPHLQAAPAAWFEDNLHWGGFVKINGFDGGPPSKFVCASIEILLDHICN
jgi:hypothetical protein